MKNACLVGYDREIITPENGTPLGGYGNGHERLSTGKTIEDDDLFVTAVAMTDGDGNTVMILTSDLVRMPFGVSDDIRNGIERKTGVPAKNILVSATHSHSTPEIIDGYDEVAEWRLMFIEKAVLAAVRALEDRRESAVFTGSGKTEELTYSRRYMKDGEFFATNRYGGDAHETPGDKVFRLVKFKREGAKDILLMNWASHPDHSYSIGGAEGTPEFHRGVSADYIYSLRKTAEEKTGALFGFFQGAAGNLVAVSAIKGEQKRVPERMKKDGVPRFVAYGRELADEVLGAYENLSETDPGRANSAERDVIFEKPFLSRDTVLYKKSLVAYNLNTGAGDIEKSEYSAAGADYVIGKYELGSLESARRIAKDPSDEKYDFARCAVVLADGGKLDAPNANTRKCAESLAFFGLGIKEGMYGCTRNMINAVPREKGDEKINVTLSAVSFGNIAFVGAPFEVFAETGIRIRESSPFAQTFVCEQTNGYLGYLPTAEACGHGGYEVAATNVAYGSAEIYEEKAILMLKELFDKR